MTQNLSNNITHVNDTNTLVIRHNHSLFTKAYAGDFQYIQELITTKMLGAPFLSQEDDEGNTLLHIAIMHGNVDAVTKMIDLIINHPVQNEKSNNNCLTALNLAVLNFNASIQEGVTKNDFIKIQQQNYLAIIDILSDVVTLQQQSNMTLKTQINEYTINPNVQGYILSYKQPSSEQNSLFQDCCACLFKSLMWGDSINVMHPKIKPNMVSNGGLF